MASTHYSDSAPAAMSGRSWGLTQRRGLLLVAISPVVANLIGSAFNIWYNDRQIEPMLSHAQQDRFSACWQWFNLVIYPLAVASWVTPLVWLRKTHWSLLEGKAVEPTRLVQAQRCVVNLPWWILAVAGVSWLICIPVFWSALAALPEPLNRTVVWHLIISFLTGGLIAVTHSFFAVEFMSQRALFPVYFQRDSPAEVPGGVPLTLRMRGKIWALSAVVCPVVILVLLLIAPAATTRDPWLPIAVGVVAIAFGMITGTLLDDLVADPVDKLKNAAIDVSEGDLDVRVNLLRADDFGPLIDRFNGMVNGLRERERLQQTFGRHVGQEAARQILAQGEGSIDAEREITVMFVDVRNFTAHSAEHSAEEVVAALNVFFRHAVETIESHGGMVNKFLGDGFMALFGIGNTSGDHARQAFEAACAMLCCLDDASEELASAGWPGLKIGIGLNTGPAVVGSIGSPQRQEYTAIGDTINVASRVEALTKAVGRNLLLTEATRRELPDDVPLESLPPQEVKGKDGPLEIYAARV